MAAAEYRTWLDNGDAYTELRSVDEVIDDIESEISLATGAILVTRGDMSRDQTLQAVEHLKFLIEQSSI